MDLLDLGICFLDFELFKGELHFIQVFLLHLHFPHFSPFLFFLCVFSSYLDFIQLEIAFKNTFFNEYDKNIRTKW